MITQITPGEPTFIDNAILRAIDAAAPIDAWTIDELDQYADLDSIRSAWMHSDGASA
jgi:hypothetical protein